MAYEGYKGYGTPEQVKRRREIAQALAAQIFRGSKAPQSYGGAIYQGLGDVGTALASRGIRKKADKAEREGRESARSQNREAIARALNGLSGGQSRVPVSGAGQGRTGAVRPSADSIDPDGRGTAPQQWSPGMAERAINEPPVDTAALQGVDPRTVDAFGNLQASYGQPLTVTSGLRSPEHNARVGGADQSRHMAEHGGDAVDIDTSGMSEAEKQQLLQQASAQGFTGIGVYDNSVHLDRGPPRAWGPSYGRESVPSWAQPVVEAHLSGSQMAQAPTASMTDATAQPAPQQQPDMEYIEGLMSVLENPWSSEGDKAMAQMVLEQELARMQPMDPGDRYKVVGGRLVDLAAEGGPSVAVGAVDKPNTIERDAEAMVQAGMDPETAQRFASGRYVRVDDDYGRSSIYDTYLGQTVENPSDLRGTVVSGAAAPFAGGAGQQAGASQPAPRPVSRDRAPGDVGSPEAAVGGEGIVSYLGNTVADLIGAPLPAPESAKAHETFNDLWAQTQMMLSDAFPGRPSVRVLDILDNFTVKPASVFQGEQRAAERLGRTRDFIDQAINHNRGIVENSRSYPPKEVAQAREKLSQLPVLRAQYEKVLTKLQAEVGVRQGELPPGWSIEEN